MIQNIEDLRSELNMGPFRKVMDRDVLDYGEIQIYKFWTNDGIAAGIAHEIGAINLPARRGCGS